MWGENRTIYPGSGLGRNGTHIRSSPKKSLTNLCPSSQLLWMRLGVCVSKWTLFENIPSQYIIEKWLNLEHIKSIYKSVRQIQPNTKWTKDLNKNTTKEDIQITTKHMKWSLILLIILISLKWKSYTHNYHYTHQTGNAKSLERSKDLQILLVGI